MSRIRNLSAYAKLTHISDTARSISVTVTNTAIITANTTIVTIDDNAHNSILATVEGSDKIDSFAYFASMTTMSWHLALSSLTSTASEIQYMSTSNINMSSKYFNSFVSNATEIFWSEFNTHSLISETGMNSGFKSMTSDESMILSIITSYEIAIFAVQFVISSGQFSSTSLKFSSDVTRATTIVSDISSTLISSSNSFARVSQITFKSVDESLHLFMTFCVLAVILSLVCELWTSFYISIVRFVMMFSFTQNVFI